MRHGWLLFVLLGAPAWGQAAPGAPPPQQPAQVPDTSATVPPDAPVITVKGVCPAQPKPAQKGAAATTAAKPAAIADCKTVLTKAEFEKLAGGLSPNMTPQLRRQLASLLPRLIAMSSEAKKRGLDKTPRYEQTLRFAKMQILTQELQRSIQDEAAKVSPEEIAKYYKDHPDAYEQYSVERLFVPRTKQMENEITEEKDQKDSKPTEEQLKAQQEEQKTQQAAAEQEMTKLAEDLRTRAAAGEDFMKLQKEAFAAAGMKIESPTVSLPKIRRTGLPPGHAAVFDLKVGEVSQVINDSGGHYFYRLTSKETLPLDQVKDEIHNLRQNQNARDMMDKLNNSFHVETNEAYFGPGGLGGSTPPSPRMPIPRPMPAPTAPAAKPQAPPANQPPAQSPDAPQK